MSKLCLIYNSAPHYRASIFQLIDSEYTCDYVFGLRNGDIKQFDTSALKGESVLVNNRRIGSLYYQPKVLSLALGGKYDIFFFLGDTRCISTWISSIIIRLLYPHKRVYYWTHGWYGKETTIEKCLKKLFYRLANGGVFLYGSYARNLMIAQGFNPDKLFVIHNSLAYGEQLQIRNSLSFSPVYKTHFGNNNHVLLFVGRLTKVKRLDLLLGAMRLTQQSYNLIVIGDGIERKTLHSIVENYGLEDNVWFYGPSYVEAELSHLISNADLCVSPGNVGLTAMHSMVYGTPVLTHNDFTWQMPEFEAIHEGETGAFFNRDDINSLARAIDNWFGHEGYDRESIRKKCYDEIDNNWTPKFQLEVLKENLI